MKPVTSQLIVTLLISALGLGVGTVFAQSGGSSSGGGSSGGGSSGSSSSAGAGRGGGSAASVGRTGAGSMAPRVRGTDSGVGTNDPRSLSNQPATSFPGSAAPGTYAPGSGPAPAGTSTPSGTGYPSGTALEAARQRALQGPAGTAIPPTAAGVGANRSSTSEVGSDSSTDAATPGLPNQAQANRDAIGNPENRTGGGSSNRQGATGATMQECEAAWDAKTHMSKDKWRETCSRTLTDPHL